MSYKPQGRQDTIVQKLKKANSLSESTKLILDLSTQDERYFFEDINERFLGDYAYAYDNYFKNRPEAYEALIEQFFERTSFAENPANCLDFGCGSGLLLIKLCKLLEDNKKFGEIDLYGVDKSEVMIDLAKKNAREQNVSNKIEFFSNKEEDRLGELEIGYILSSSVFHLIKDPSKTIEKMLESLSERGEIFIQDVMRDSPWDLKQKRLIHLAKKLEREEFLDAFKGHLSALSKRDMRNILEELKGQHDFSYEIFDIERKNYFDLTLGTVIKKNKGR